MCSSKGMLVARDGVAEVLLLLRRLGRRAGRRESALLAVSHTGRRICRTMIARANDAAGLRAASDEFGREPDGLVRRLNIVAASNGRYSIPQGDGGSICPKKAGR